MKATEKQIAYAMRLMSLAGYGPEWMRAEHKHLGATMRERSGRVVDWLSKKSRHDISALIDLLEKLADESTSAQA